MLVHSDTPEKADLVVMLRGSLFDRSMQTAELYNEGYAAKVYLPRVLSDDLPAQFATFGVHIIDDQTKLRNIFIQTGVDSEDIILSMLAPGGGTIGEARRVKKDIEDMDDIKSIIVVTSWFHTRRSHRIYSSIFKGSGINVQVVASRYGNNNPSNWWHYRYVTLNVLTEIPKLFLSFVDPATNIPFKDDPDA